MQILKERLEQLIEAKPGTKAEIVLIVLMEAIIVLTYSPSLGHAARAEQLIYLFLTSDKTDLWSLTAGSYALNRDPIMPGDELLFRPVLYSLLGFEKWLFGYDFHLWQLASLLLHLGICFLMYRILRDAHKEGILPFLLTLLFGVLYIAMEMVIWHHMSGYLLFCLLFLYSFQQFRKFKNQPSWPNFFPLYIGLLLAAFTYEAGNAAAGWVGIYFLLVNIVSMRREDSPQRVGWIYPLILLSIPILYLTLSIADYNSRFGSFGSGVGHLGASRPGVLTFVEYELASGAFWLFTGFDPLYFKLAPTDPSIGRVAISGWLGANSHLLIIGAIPVLLFGIGYGIRRAGRQQIQGYLPEIAFLLIMMLAYTLIIVVGREIPKVFGVQLAGNPYYAYIFDLFGILLIGFTLAPLNVAIASGKLADVLIVGSLLMVIAFNGWMTFAFNRVMLDYTQPTWVLVEQVEQLIQAHGSEPGFSFSVDRSCRGNASLGWDDLRDHPPTSLKVAETLYPHSYVEQGGKYLVSCSESNQLGN